MSPAQLEFCIRARQDYLPTLKDLASKTSNDGLTPDHVAQWFLKVESCHPAKKSANDSAYQSRTNPSSKENIPKKKRKRSEGDDGAPKPYQCTHSDSAGKYCLREICNFTDWKRHEEIHSLQRKWVCLIQGSNGAVSCHICAGNIDLVGQQSFTTHTGCFGVSDRKGHVFLRKDKLQSHVKNSHGCVANIDAWYVDIPSDWKKQCGFCGSTFTDWDTRCNHVGDHFTLGKRMEQDWKDPWPLGRGVLSQGPGDDDDDDDEDDNDDNDNGYHDYGVPSNQNLKNGAGKKSGGPGNSRGDNGSTVANSNDQRHQQNSSLDCGKPGDADNSLQKRELQFREIRDGSPSLHSSSDQVGKGTVGVFESVQTLGYGAFGIVDEVKHCATKIHFARKTIRVNSRRSASALSQARREVVALRQLKHQHIISILASYSCGDHFSIIMFPVADHNLSQFLFDENATTLPQISKLSRWIGCLTSAVSYMHEKFWQHLDIKPSNILISGGHVMLADFGGSLLMDEPYSKKPVGTNYIITPMYCAPEIRYRNTSLVVPGACDIFSLGCVLLEMVTVIHREKLRTFVDFRSYGSDDASYSSNNRKTCIWIEHLSNINESLGLPHQDWLELITRMLSVDSKKRPTAHDLVQSYLFQAYQMKKKPDEGKYLVVANSNGYVEPIESAKLWLEDCRTYHRNCTSPTRSFFPSRILNVGTHGDFIRLQSTLLLPPGPYVTLSHCWGSGRILKTTLKTLDGMTSRIEISSLPATFADAVRVTQALGFEYLWIDALCIIQDSEEDWMIESSKMGKIYSNSSLNLSAVDGGQIFQNFEPRFLSYKAALKDSRALCSSCSNNYTAFDPLCQKTATTMLLDSPLSQRGWAFQERLLSPRILHFSETSIAWECRTTCSTFDTVSLMRKSLKLLFLEKDLLSQKLNNSLNGLSHISNDHIKFWKDIVCKYSKLKLSLSQDKLPALSGIARIIAQGSGATYVAGLWKEDLLTGLLWSRDFATVPLSRPPYRAPSWSWASIDSPVIWSKFLLDGESDPQVEIMDCQVSLVSDISPFGAVSDGQLVMRGPMQRVTITRTSSEQLLKRGSLTPFAFAQWDALDAKSEAPQQGGISSNQRRRVWCLQILNGVGLMLKQVTVKDSECFERIGIFWIEDKVIVESKKDCDWEVRIINLI